MCKFGFKHEIRERRLQERNSNNQTKYTTDQNEVEMSHEVCRYLLTSCSLSPKTATILVRRLKK